MPKVDITFIQEPSSYKTKLEQVNAFLDNCVHELAGGDMYYKILSEREEFVNWLKNKDLLWLLDNPTRVKNRVHWDHYLSVLHVFVRFDLLLAQCMPFEESQLYYRDQQRFEVLVNELNKII